MKLRGTNALFLTLVCCFSICGAANGQTKPVAEPLPPTYVRVYDIRELILPVQDFPLSSSPNARAFVATAGTAYTTSLGQGGGTTPPATAQGDDPLQKSTQSSMDELFKLIEDNVDSDTWKDMGGRIGSLHVFHGLMGITETKETNERIVELLDDITSDQASTVNVDAHWLLMSSADASRLNKSTAGDQLPTGDPALLENRPAGVKHFAAQTVSRSGQTVYVISGLNRSLLTSAIPVVSTGVAAYSLDLTNVLGGIALEINSRINSHQGTASITLYSSFSDPVPNSQGSTINISSLVTTRPAGAGLNAELPIASGLQPFSRIVQDMRTSVRIPLGVPVLVGGMTLQPDSKGSDEQQLLLVLKVTASK
jgi:hypothetical protein